MQRWANIGFCGLLALSAHVQAQPCDGTWLHGPDMESGDPRIWANATASWDPDGPGPKRELLVVGGRFASVGGVWSSNIAAYDPETQTWTGLGVGVGSPDTESVLCVVVMPNNDLVVGGTFTTAGGQNVSRVARWNGTGWSDVGGGVAGSAVACMKVMPNGDLGVGGSFGTAGGVPAKSAALWDGAQWKQLGAGLNDTVTCLETMPNGDLIAGGYFTASGSTSASWVARWNGSQWSAVPSGPGYASLTMAVTGMTVCSNGDLVVGNRFNTAGNVKVTTIGRWNGAGWQPLGSTMTGSFSSIWAIKELPEGSIVVGGNFGSVQGIPANGIARWDGVNWEPMDGGSFVSEASSFSLLSTGDLIASGGSVGRWNGSAWGPLGNGMVGVIKTLRSDRDGRLIAGGTFTAVDGVLMNRVGIRDEVGWRALGSGMNGTVSVVLPLANGDILAAGDFTKADGKNISRIARWNGETWNALGSGNGPSGPIWALAELPNGDIVAGGEFLSAGGVQAKNVARWDGGTWSAMGAGHSDRVNALCVLPNGDLIAGGRFIAVESGKLACFISRWTGTSWQSLGGGFDYAYNDDIDEIGVLALRVLRDGNLVAVGTFDRDFGQTRDAAKWTGSEWIQLGYPVGRGARDVVERANGELIVVGSFTNLGLTNHNHVARWSPGMGNVSWQPLGLGTDGTLDAVAEMPDGEIVVGGAITLAGGGNSFGWARWRDESVPAVVVQPLPVTSEAGDSVMFAAQPADGYASVSYRWKRNGGLISDGPEGASVGGGIVSGSSGSFALPTYGDRAILRIANVKGSDGGEYTIEFVTSCGDSTSVGARLLITCEGDLVVDGIVDDSDFATFLVGYDLLLCDDSAMPSGCPGDLNRDGFVDDADFQVFVRAYSRMICE